MTQKHSDGWQEQWKRVSRWRARIGVQPRPAKEYEDYLWAFFQNAWHLKDWIKKDEKLAKGIRSQIEGECSACASLQICADLANRSKHCTLDRYNRKDAAVQGRVYHVHKGIHYPSGRTRQRTRWDYRVTVAAGPGRKALLLADEVIGDWEAILRKLGLLTSTR